MVIISAAPISITAEDYCSSPEKPVVTKKRKRKNKQKKVSTEILSFSFAFAQEQDQLGMLYKVLELHVSGKTLVLITDFKRFPPQYVASVLKQLNFQAFAVHNKSPKAQRIENFSRFSTHSSCSKIVLVSTPHAIQGLAKQKANVVCVGNTCSVPVISSSSILISSDNIEKPSRELPEICKNALPRAKSRVNVAMKLVEKNNVGLQQKLTLMLAEPLVLRSGKRETTQELQEKLEILQLGSNTLKASIDCEKRTSAQTSWLDLAPGERFQCPWTGSSRHGASKDIISLKLRQNLKQLNWKPNDQPDDVHDWGGPYGKPCGHNEVVMHQVRPFFPQVVLNSRLCSREHPAPGNRNFDGCLEYLQEQCRQQQQAMTIWDAYQYHYISEEGEVESIDKREFLRFDLVNLRRVIPTLRAQTIACQGSISPAQLMQRIETVIDSLRQLKPRIRDTIAEFYFEM